MSAKLDSSILTNMRDDCYVTTWIRIFPDGDFTYQNDIYVGTSVAHESPDLPFLGDTDEITRNEYGDCYDLKADAELSDLIKRAEFQIIDYWFTYLADEYKITPEDLGFTSWYEEN